MDPVVLWRPSRRDNVSDNLRLHAVGEELVGEQS